MRTRPHRRSAVVATAAALIGSLTLWSGSPAGASLNDSASASHTLATGSLSPPTSPAVNHGPCNIILGPTLTVSWATSPSTWASGYEVGQALVSGGPYTTLYGVAGQGTTSFTTPNLLFGTTYYFVVKATKGAWRSTPTTQVSRTTKAVLCI